VRTLAEGLDHPECVDLHAGGGHAELVHRLDGTVPDGLAFPELDRVVRATLGRRHRTALDLGLRGAPLHRPERWAIDALAEDGA
jgi:hypothetical protein